MFSYNGRCRLGRVASRRSGIECTGSIASQIKTVKWICQSARSAPNWSVNPCVPAFCAQVASAIRPSIFPACSEQAGGGWGTPAARSTNGRGRTKCHCSAFRPPLSPDSEQRKRGQENPALSRLPQTAGHYSQRRHCRHCYHDDRQICQPLSLVVLHSAPSCGRFSSLKRLGRKCLSRSTGRPSLPRIC